MAVAPTGAIYKALEFDGVSSRTYGVYITGEAVYNAPERDVEMVTIPGRNGTYALDNGRFENIEVSYPAGIFAETEADFRQAISEFRNFLCSRKGYVRLQDEYNPDEYRLAVYKSGLEVDPAMLRAGEFDIVFDCKPQRFLTSGETAVSVDSGDTLTNPTLFEASPMIVATVSSSFNTGSIKIANSNYPAGDRYEIWLTNGDTGNIVFVEGKSEWYFSYKVSKFESGNEMSVTLSSAGLAFKPLNANPIEITSYSKTSGTLNTSVSNVEYRTSVHGSLYPVIWFDINQVVSLSATEDGEIKDTYTVNVKRTPSGGSAVTTAYTVEVSAQINVAGVSAQFAARARVPSTSPGDSRITPVSAGDAIKYAAGYSTVPALDGTVYIDTAIGMAYKYDASGNRINLNRFVEMRSDLPVLAPGENTITHYVGSLNIAPRWWKI